MEDRSEEPAGLAASAHRPPLNWLACARDDAGNKKAPCIEGWAPMRLGFGLPHPVADCAATGKASLHPWMRVNGKLREVAGMAIKSRCSRHPPGVNQRRNMQGLLALVAFIGIWTLVATQLKKHGMPGWPRHLLGGFLGMIAFIIIVPASDNPKSAAAATEAGAKAEAKAAKEPEPTPPEKPTLGLTLEQWVENFNASAESTALKDRATVPTEFITGPAQDAASIKLAEDHHVNLALKKDTREVREVTFLGAGDGTQVSSLKLMVAAMATLQAAVPAEDRPAVAEALGKLLKEFKPGSDSTHVIVDDRKVWIIISPQMGFWAGIAPAEDE